MTAATDLASSPVLDALLAEREKAPAEVDSIVRRIREAGVGIVVAPSEAADPMVQRLAAAAVNLLARTFASIAIDAPHVPTQGAPLMAAGPSLASGLADLARVVNPKVEMKEGRGAAGRNICFGAAAEGADGALVADVDGWECFIARDASNSPWERTSRRHHPASPLAGASLAVAQLLAIVLGKETQAPSSYKFSLLTLIRNDDSAPNPQVDGLRFHDVHIVGCGSIGCAVLYCAESASAIQGRLVLLDHEQLDDRNPRKYVLMAHQDVGRAKATHFGSRLRISHPKLEVEPHKARAEEWASALERNYRIPMLVICPDKLDARRHAADLLARVAIVATTEGTTATVNHCHFATTYCPYCMYVPTSDETAHMSDQLSRRTGIHRERVIQLSLPIRGREPERLNEEDIAVLESHLHRSPRSLRAWLGRFFGEFVAAETEAIYSTIPLGSTDVSPFRIDAACVSALAGAMAFSEIVKELDPTLHEFAASYGSYHHDLLDAGNCWLIPARRDRSFRCLCWNADRQVWYAELWPEDADAIRAWCSSFDDWRSARHELRT